MTRHRRFPLDAGLLAAALAGDGLSVRVVQETGSTNADLVAAAKTGAGEGLVLVAEHQWAGRGRLDRSWASPSGAGLTFSVLLRPAVPAGALGWLPLVTGLSLASTLREFAGIPAGLKWPNDVLVAGEKLAGILAEAVPDRDRSGTVAVIVGIGLNVDNDVDELPPGATSVALRQRQESRPLVGRGELLIELLRGLVRVYRRWLAEPTATAAAYRSVCDTLGQRVRVELPDGSVVTGTATDVDDHGRLVVDGRAFAAGDVVHLR
ncbi:MULTISPECIES: biotin--[acetyl-CoA-carboxylase] ligase [Protofrankia]|uniref:biotin--[biotin carboxyl-carrier protein] ligase n=1 Tax=Candidatus Protofrankia datiscae TaxID=2716812 RepID=F8AY33_9ACTN|nr:MULTISPECIES: biotin--[acetyl-CoA-carboxylase] ligase [Protofrankia]AEH08534.1 biotin/acetyl-CoA-carboxylase ligase [Candidatus Protofrankia datiscae]